VRKKIEIRISTRFQTTVIFCTSQNSALTNYFKVNVKRGDRQTDN